MSERLEDVLPEFYIVVTPGLEALAAAELKTWCPQATPRLDRGGLTVQLGLREGLELNSRLKTATRILLRMAIFGCSDFPKLFKKVSNFPWTEWIEDGQSVEFQASSHASRLFVKKRIESTCEEARQKAVKGKLLAAGQPVTVFVRLNDDVCTLSLDTSGEILHKRGQRPLSSDAPLRESMAAALLMLLEEARPITQQPVELVDPMAGGGTFLLEAAGLRHKVTTRKFAYENCKPLLTKIGSASGLQEVAHGAEKLYASFVGFEADGKIAQAAKTNLEPVLRGQALTFIEADFFSSSPLPSLRSIHTNEGGFQARWLVVNPPYGERLRIEGRLSDYYERLFEASERIVRPERACFLLPQKANVKRLRLPRGWEVLRELAFSNGGLPVVAFVVGRSEQS